MDNISPGYQYPTHEGSRLRCKIAQNRQDREAAFRLVYQAYTRSGLIDPNPFRMRAMPHHLLPTTQVFLAGSDEGGVISTVTLIGDGELGVPLDSIYGEETDRLRDQGIVFGEVSCLADRRRDFRRVLPMFVQLTRLMAQFARFQGLDMLLIAVHPRHARFYSRFLGFEIFGEERLYPTVRNNPAVACCLDFNRIDRDRPACYDQYFGTAIPDVDLMVDPMPEREQQYFSRVIEHSSGMLTPVFV